GYDAPLRVGFPWRLIRGKMIRPTEEQSLALERFRTGRPLKIVAFAGAGKTSTLQILANSRATRGVYLAFNKSVAAEAAQRFPTTVDCRTIHSIAWRAVQSSHRFSTGKLTNRLYARQLADALALEDRTFERKFRLHDVHQAHLLLRTLRTFCQSSDPEICAQHVPRYGRLLGASETVLADVLDWVVVSSKSLWQRMLSHRDIVPLGHDGYLKLWAL